MSVYKHPRVIISSTISSNSQNQTEIDGGGGWSRVAWSGAGYKEKIKIWGVKWKRTTREYREGESLIYHTEEGRAIRLGRHGRICWGTTTIVKRKQRFHQTET